ncbi:MAG: NAD(P)-dependent alcohol dehydrogenase [Bacteroidota bacterium]
MKAITRTHYGGPEKLKVEEIDPPKPGPKELLVKVHYTTVNRTDCGALWGKPWIYRLFIGWPNPKVPTPGTDLAGEIVSIGSEVEHLRVGDRVIAFDDNGNLASQRQYTILTSRLAKAKIPEGVSYDIAAASIEGAHYAYHFIKHADVQKGQRVLLHGATGAIGSAGVQFLKHMEAHVTATSTTKSLDLIKGLGADKVIDWETEDYLRDQEPYDFFFDAVGKSAFGWCKHLLKPQGVYISSELGPRSENPFRALVGLFQSGRRVKFPIPGDVKESLDYISNRLADGSFRPLIDRTYAIEDIEAAYEYVCSGRKQVMY